MINFDVGSASKIKERFKNKILLAQRFSTNNHFLNFLQANILLLPCRHLTLCTQCAPYQPEDTCPKCRKEYDVMIDFFWGDEDKTDEISTTPTACNQDTVVQPDQLQSQPVITQQLQVSEIAELEFGVDLRLLFNQII